MAQKKAPESPVGSIRTVAATIIPAPFFAHLTWGQTVTAWGFSLGLLAVAQLARMGERA